MKSIIALFSVVLVSISSVAAHGYVNEVVIGGKTYPGFRPFVDPFASPIPARVIRNIPNDGPITTLGSPDLVCNKGGAKGAGLVADAPAGSKVTFKWTNWPDDHRGPVTTWMTKCTGSCKSFDPTNAKFFKIDEAGFKNGQWASQKLIQQGNSWTVTIPPSLEQGEYLIRHEIMAMHDTSAAQMYPSCAQVRVTGGGSSEPTTKDTAKITDVYRAFKEPDIWADGFNSFAIQGPPVARLATGSGNTNTPPPPPADDDNDNNDNTPTVPSTPASSSAAQVPPSAPARPTSTPVKSTQPTAPPNCRASRKLRRRRHHAKRMYSH